MNYNIDIKETNIFKLDSKLLEVLLIDHSSKKNLIWATDNYASRGVGYQSYDHITSNAIIKRNGSVIKPRVEKSKKNKHHVLKTKPRFLPHHGFVMHKITLLMMLGLEKEMYSTPKQIKDGLLILRE